MPARTATAGQVIRHWRRRRGLSQLELSLRTGVSTRHLSCVETGRAAASRQLLRFLAEELDIPPMERNVLLLAAGYAPEFSEESIDAPVMQPVLAALARLLDAHEPYPAVVVDGRWNVVARNASAVAFTAGVAPELAGPPVNVLRSALHPRGLAPRIANFSEWSSHLLRRASRQIERTGDPDLVALVREVRGYPGVTDVPPGGHDLFVPLRIRYRDAGVHLFNTLTTFAAPLNVALADLVLETFHPADAATAAVFQRPGHD